MDSRETRREIRKRGAAKRVISSIDDFKIDDNFQIDNENYIIDTYDSTGNISSPNITPKRTITSITPRKRTPRNVTPNDTISKRITPRKTVSVPDDDTPAKRRTRTPRKVNSKEVSQVITPKRKTSRKSATPRKETPRKDTTKKITSRKATPKKTKISSDQDSKSNKRQRIENPIEETTSKRRQRKAKSTSDQETNEYTNYYNEETVNSTKKKLTKKIKEINANLNSSNSILIKYNRSSGFASDYITSHNNLNPNSKIAVYRNNKLITLDILNQIIFDYFQKISDDYSNNNNKINKLISKYYIKNQDTNTNTTTSNKSINLKIKKFSKILINFKEYLKKHFNNLIDLIITNNLILNNLNFKNLIKNDKRLIIFKIRKSLKNLNFELIKLRSKFNNFKLKFNLKYKNFKKLIELKDIESITTTTTTNNNKFNNINIQLNELSSIINPNIGILNSFKNLNLNLKQLNKNLS